jgi:hypothetical protein
LRLINMRLVSAIHRKATVKIWTFGFGTAAYTQNLILLETRVGASTRSSVYWLIRSNLGVIFIHNYRFNLLPNNLNRNRLITNKPLYGACLVRKIGNAKTLHNPYWT